MSKYIDAERLKKLIDNLESFSCISEEQDGFYSAISRINDIIESLQQEQQLPGMEDGGIPGKDFIPVEWVDACEQYGKWKIVQQERTCKTCGFYENNCPFIRGKLITYPNKVCKDYTCSAMKEHKQPEVDLEKAARNVYESWMGGTMDDVRRDMVELGKVLYERKEE